MHYLKPILFAACTMLILLALTNTALAGKGKTSPVEASVIIKAAIDSLQQEYENRSPDEGEEINWEVLSSGGAKSTDGTFIINGTLGQTAVGTSTDGASNTHHGFWQNFEFKWECGDANHSGYTDIDDIIYLVGYIFLGGPAPDPLEIGDVNCLDEVDIDDVTYLVNYVFLGGPLPCDPNGDGVQDCP
jgi:hypothetical protein